MFIYRNILIFGVLEYINMTIHQVYKINMYLLFYYIDNWFSVMHYIVVMYKALHVVGAIVW